MLASILKTPRPFMRSLASSSFVRNKSSSSPSSPRGGPTTSMLLSTMLKNQPTTNQPMKEIAYDMFFSGHRPLFLHNHNLQSQQQKSAEVATESDGSEVYMPWDVSVSGLTLNPDMKSVPRSVVRNLVPFHPDPVITPRSVIVEEGGDAKASLDRIKELLLGDYAAEMVVYSPSSKSFGRVVHATSVKRKRKLKMNKHKLRKRRKLQRSLRRKLKR